jgi:type IV pilus assembly protein PilQ
MRMENMEQRIPAHGGVAPAAWLLGVLSWLVAATAGAATLQAIEFASLPGDKTEIRMQFDGPPPSPQGYTIESPARIALDLPGAKSGLATKYHSLGIGNAREVTVIEAKDRTRVIVNLTQLVPYVTTVEGNSLLMVVGAGAEAGVGLPTPQRHGDAAVSQTAAAALGSSTITSVDFRRSADGEGRVIVTLSNPKVPVEVSSESGKVKAVVRNTELPAEFRRRLDVTDFATPVQVVDAVQSGPDVVFTVSASGNWDYLAYQADQTLAINVNPITPQELALREDVFRFKGEKLSLNFQDIEVRSVLQLIADFTDLNLVASDTVSGRITLRLKNVPWDQALELILKTKGLDKRQAGNVMMVGPAAEIAAREKLELENQRQLSELAPLRTEFVQVRYANAGDMFKLFESAGDKSKKSMLSDRGSVIVDERTNALIITDTTDRLEELRRVVAQLDIPVRQVLIEARIVTASTNFQKELGIRWGGGGYRLDDNNTFGSKVGGSLTTLSELQNIIVDGTGSITSPDNLVVDLGVASSQATTFGIGFTGANWLVDLEISALASDGHAEVVARPKVITADKQKAIIQSGTEIPYQEASSSGATSTSFKEAVLALEVTPQITPDDRIIMDLKVNQDTVGEIFNNVPSIDTNEIQTQVLVDNGQTLVLGGIFKDERAKAVVKTPFLGDLPYLGRLFRKNLERSEKQELLIFITPRIIKDSVSAR